MSGPRDEWKRTHRENDTWTPPHGTRLKRFDSKRNRAKLRDRLRAVVDRVLGRPSVVEHAQRDDEDRVYCDCPRDQHDYGCPWRLS